MAETLLAIETSCDETSAAVLTQDQQGRPRLDSLVILSQDVHRVFGGVVPELASRAHLTTLDPVVRAAIEDAGRTLPEIDTVAVTAGPGLIGALMVGVCYAKGLAAAGARRLVGVHHIEGHIFAPTLEDPDLEPPFVALIVSGGHTLLFDVPDWGSYRLLGRTRDDAAGEAFDKVAKLLGLGYPGGPEIERVAREGDDLYHFPRPLLGEGLDFSFSGLKTAVLYQLNKMKDWEENRADLARSFQEAVFDVLLAKADAALGTTGYDCLILGGGVACSQTLTEKARARFEPRRRVAVASPRFNSDNAGMIARAGWFHAERGRWDDLSLEPDAAMPLPGLETHNRVQTVS